jgi:hypothetical protein
MSFAADISKFVEKTKLKADVVVRKLAMDGLAGVVRMSPVDTGRFRGSWRVGVNRVDLETEPKGNQHKDKNGHTLEDPFKQKAANTNVATAKALSEGSKQIAQAKFGDVIAITNNLAYGPPLERGHSKQAPQGMLRVTFMRLQTQLKRMVGSL